MKTCKKVGFDNFEIAQKRASEIYKENKKIGNVMRVYKCDECFKYHLTKMTKDNHRYVTDKEYRKKKNLSAFLRRETEYWEEKLKINNND